VPRPKNHAVSREGWFVGFAAEGGKAKQQFCSSVPHASKQPFGKTNSPGSLWVIMFEINFCFKRLARKSSFCGVHTAPSKRPFPAPTSQRKRWGVSPS
jgi:hypothetical protein